MVKVDTAAEGDRLELGRRRNRAVRGQERVDAVEGDGRLPFLIELRRQQVEFAVLNGVAARAGKGILGAADLPLVVAALFLRRVPPGGSARLQGFQVTLPKTKTCGARPHRKNTTIFRNSKLLPLCCL